MIEFKFNHFTKYCNIPHWWDIDPIIDNLGPDDGLGKKIWSQVPQITLELIVSGSTTSGG